jgi:hypothetical protein
VVVGAMGRDDRRDPGVEGSARDRNGRGEDGKSRETKRAQGWSRDREGDKKGEGKGRDVGGALRAENIQGTYFIYVGCLRPIVYLAKTIFDFVAETGVEISPMIAVFSFVQCWPA